MSGCLFRGVACMTQALFAANDRYFVNEKGSVRAADSFAARPEGFGEAASEVARMPRAKRRGPHREAVALRGASGPGPRIVRRGDECSVDFTGDVALEAADDLAFALAPVVHRAI